MPLHVVGQIIPGCNDLGQIVRQIPVHIWYTFRLFKSVFCMYRRCVGMLNGLFGLSFSRTVLLGIRPILYRLCAFIALILGRFKSYPRYQLFRSATFGFFGGCVFWFCADSQPLHGYGTVLLPKHFFPANTPFNQGTACSG